MFKRIVTPLDGSSRSEAVLPYVRLLATASDCPVTLLRAAEFDEGDSSADFAELDAAKRAQEVKEGVLAQTDQYLQNIKATLPNLNVETVVSQRDPHEAIIEEAEKGGSETLVTMSTHGRTGLRRILMGSITQKTLQNSSNPMLIIRPDIDDDQLPREEWRSGESFSINLLRPDIEAQDFSGTASLNRLIVALDGSEAAEISLEASVEIAKVLDAALLLVRVASPSMQMSMTSDWPAGYPDILRAVEDSCATYLQAKATELQSRGMSKVGVTVLRGEPAREIVEASEKTSENMIVMTRKSRAGITRALLGSVSAEVVNRSSVPVLLIQPD